MTASLIASVTGSLVKKADGVPRPCLAIDHATVDLAPFSEFPGLYDDLCDVVAVALTRFGPRLSASEPVIVATCEVVDGRPFGPIRLSIPRNDPNPVHRALPEKEAV